MISDKPKIALVHDHLTQDGGAERVLRVLSEMYPDAPIYTLVHTKKIPGISDRANVKTSFLSGFPFNLTKFEWLLPLMPSATEHYNLRGFDIVISSASSCAKGVITRPDAKHICYCHTPTRYLWTEMHDYIDHLKLPKTIKKFLPIYLSHLRQWDRHAADRVDHFIANSRTVSDRIKKFYRRDSHVIYPPVDTRLYKISNEPKTYFLAGGRIMAYKKFDLVVRAFNRLRLPLKIFGDGPQLDEYKAMAKDNIEFIGRVSDEEKARLYENCIAYINPQEEDFGITVIEAMASGRPVIAYAKGGATETVIDGRTGAFFHKQEWEYLGDAIIMFDQSKFNPVAIKEHAETYSKQNFMQSVASFVATAYENRD
jgi:glycosyltransferase involved in cell wall biosynthesis